MTDAPEWFEDDLDERHGSRRRWLAIVAAVAATWIVIAAVVLGRSSADGAADDTSTATDPTLATSAADDTPPQIADEPPGDADHDRSIDLGGTSDPAAPVPALGDETVTRQELDALALVVVRAWLSDGGPDLELPGIDTDRRAYLEHAAVESVEVAGDLAVARAVLILLVRDGDHYTEAVVRRAAVPFQATLTSIQPAGTPWWLPGTSSVQASAPPAVPDDDPAAIDAVGQALSAAGYLDASVSSVAVTPTGTVVAEVTARTPTDDEIDGPVWLHPTSGGLVVLGGDHHRPPARDDVGTSEDGPERGGQGTDDPTDGSHGSGDAPD